MKHWNASTIVNCEKLSWISVLSFFSSSTVLKSDSNYNLGFKYNRFSELQFFLQSCNYFLEPVRIAAPMYFWHLYDFVRSKSGRPLLIELAKGQQKFSELLDPKSENAKEVSLICQFFLILDLIFCDVKFSGRPMKNYLFNHDKLQVLLRLSAFSET